MRLTPRVIEMINDMEIQSMLFDMDIDWETMSLVPKSENLQEEWLTRWKEKQSNADEDAAAPGQNLEIDS